MQKLKLLCLLFAALSVVTFTGCKDDDDDVSPNVSLLTAGKWTGKAIFIGSDEVTEEAAEQGFDIRKYTHEFRRDGTYTDNYTGGQPIEGEWVYENGERIIVFDKGKSSEYKVVISRLDDKEFHYIQDGLELQFVR